MATQTLNDAHAKRWIARILTLYAYKPQLFDGLDIILSSADDTPLFSWDEETTDHRALVVEASDGNLQTLLNTKPSTDAIQVFIDWVDWFADEHVAVIKKERDDYQQDNPSNPLAEGNTV